VRPIFARVAFANLLPAKTANVKAKGKRKKVKGKSGKRFPPCFFLFPSLSFCRYFLSGEVTIVRSDESHALSYLTLREIISNGTKVAIAIFG